MKNTIDPQALIDCIDFPDAIPLKQEFATFISELPNLLANGETGRHALIKGDKIVGIWDTESEAVQAGRDRFGLEPIAVQKIAPEILEKLKQHESQTQRYTRDLCD